jgi:hypothetical protein
MEWLVAPNGTCVPLSETQALRLDVRANMEDVAAAIEDLATVNSNSRKILAECYRQRRMRISRLRAVPRLRG